jgi:hypothetical protein
VVVVVMVVQVHQVIVVMIIAIKVVMVITNIHTSFSCVEAFDDPFQCVTDQVAVVAMAVEGGTVEKNHAIFSQFSFVD